MKSLPLALALFVTWAGFPASATAQLDEAALEAALRAGRVPSVAAPEDPRVEAALVAVDVFSGRSAVARQRAERSGERAGDCAWQARLAELGLGAGCDELSAARLDEAPLLGDRVAFTIVAAQPGESRRELFSGALVRSLDALAGEGGLKLETTADRFRVSGRSALEGLLYLDDRLLLAARPPAEGSANEAWAALERFLAGSPALPAPAPAARPVAAPEPPPTRARVSRRVEGWELQLPEDFVPRPGQLQSWLPISARNASFPPTDGAVEVLSGKSTAAPRKRRKAIARRKKDEPRRTVVSSPLPSGAELLASAELFGDIEELTWRRERGGEVRQSLVRSLRDDGADTRIVVHLGTRFDREAALELLAEARRAR